MDLNPRHFRIFEGVALFRYNIGRKKKSEDIQTKHGYTTVRRLKLTDFELPGIG